MIDLPGVTPGVSSQPRRTGERTPFSWEQVYELLPLSTRIGGQNARLIGSS
jgi:hypothetical protein